MNAHDRDKLDSSDGPTEIPPNVAKKDSASDKTQDRIRATFGDARSLTRVFVLDSTGDFVLDLRETLVTGPNRNALQRTLTIEEQQLRDGTNPEVEHGLPRCDRDRVFHAVMGDKPLERVALVGEENVTEKKT